MEFYYRPARLDPAAVRLWRLYRACAAFAPAGYRLSWNLGRWFSSASAILPRLGFSADT